MQPWIIERIKEEEIAKQRSSRIQPQLPIPEPLHQIAPATGTDGEKGGVVSIELKFGWGGGPAPRIRGIRRL